VHDETGNHVVTDIARGAPDATPRELVSDGDRLFFTACDGTNRSLWQSPAAGNGATPVLATAKSCRIDYNDRWWLTAGGLIYFQRADDQQKTQLWRSDGTEAGTFQLTDLPKGVVAGDVLNPGPFQGKLLFATYGSSVEEIWESDGTVAGTRKSPYLPGDFTSVGNLRAVGDELYFFAVEGQNPGLWRSDGTAAGTRKIAPLFAGSGGGPQFVRLGGAVFFFASIPGSRRQLWRTDGTLPGTQAILNVDGGLGSSYPAELILFQGSLFVLTNDDSEAVKKFRMPVPGSLCL
jgi:ELWxxDGT repeat protein